MRRDARSTPDLAGHAKSGVGWSSFSLGGTALLSLLQLSIAARFLAPGEFGVMALILVVTSLGQGLSDLGTANAVLHRQQATRAELASLFWVNVAAGVGLCAVVAACGWPLATLWGEPGLAHWLPGMALVFLPIGAAQVSLALLRRELRFRALAAGELAAALVSLAVVTALVLAGRGVLALVAGQVAGTTVRSAAALWCSRDLFIPSRHFDSSEVAPFLDFGLYQLGERIVNFASWNVDKLLVGWWLGAEALGFYSLAYQLMLRPFKLVTAVSARVTRPLLARVQADRARLLEAYFTSVRLIAFLAFPVYVGAFVVAGPLVALVYGPGWSEVAALFGLLWPLGILYAVGNPVGGLVVATGNARAGFRFQVFAAGVHLAAVLAGAPHGARGVAAALVAANVAVLFPASFALRRVLVQMEARPFLECLARPLLYASLMGVVVYALGVGAASLPAGAKLAGAAVTGAAVYGALVLTRERALLLSLRSS